MSEPMSDERLAKIEDIIDFGKTRDIHAIELSLGEELLAEISRLKEENSRLRAMVKADLTGAAKKWDREALIRADEKRKTAEEIAAWLESSVDAQYWYRMIALEVRDRYCKEANENDRWVEKAKARIDTDLALAGKAVEIIQAEEGTGDSDADVDMPSLESIKMAAKALENLCFECGTHHYGDCLGRHTGKQLPGTGDSLSGMEDKASASFDAMLESHELKAAIERSNERGRKLPDSLSGMEEKTE